EQPRDGDLAVRGHRQMPADRVVQIEQAVVAALHHQHGGERLGDRADAEPGVGVGADLERPQWTVGAVHGDRHGRDTPVALRQPDLPLVGPHGESIGPSGSPPRTCACTWNTVCRACGPVLTMTRYPSSARPSAFATAPT